MSVERAVERVSGLSQSSESVQVSHGRTDGLTENNLRRDDHLNYQPRGGAQRSDIFGGGRTHDAEAIRLPSGWLRWEAVCSCGWRRKPMGGREAAELLADEHRRTAR